MSTVQGYALREIKSVRFTAQEWINDYAHEIDPKGDVVWEPSDLEELLKGYRDLEDAFEYEPWYLEDPNCPDWIKKHDGPFYIRVHSTITEEV